MANKQTIDIYTAGCPCCDDAIELVRRIARDSCEIHVHDMHDAAVAARASDLGVRSVPAIAIDGELAICCLNRGVDEDTLRATGIGSAAK